MEMPPKRARTKNAGSSRSSTSSVLGVYAEKKWFEDPKWEDKRRLLDRRKLANDRIVDVDFFESSNGFKVMSLLDQLNMRGMVQFAPEEQRIYGNLVRDFYCFLEITVEDLRGRIRCRSYVNGKELFITPNSLEEGLKIGGRGGVVHGEYNYKVARDSVGLTGKVPWNSCHLDVDLHIIHHIMTYNILPVSGHRNAISVEHLRLLYHIQEGLKPSIGEAILRWMLRAKNHNKKHLPYGMLLTRYFRHMDVSFDGCEWIAPVGAPINCHSLSLMGIVQDEQTDLWKYNGEVPRAEELVDDDNSDEDGNVVAAQFAFGTILEQFGSDLREFKAHVTEQLGEMRGELKNLRGNIRNVIPLDELREKLGNVLSLSERNQEQVQQQKNEFDNFASSAFRFCEDLERVREDLGRNSALMNVVLEEIRKR